LLATCPTFARHAAAGEIVYWLNFNVSVGNSRWNIDLAIGPPPGPPVPPAQGTGITMARPSTIRIGVEAKSVMTEHRKAVRNRQRDLHSYHNYMHRYFSTSVIAGTVVLNISRLFYSPLRNIKTVCPQCGHVFEPMRLTRHINPAALVGAGITLFRDAHLRSDSSDQGFDALAVIVIDCENTTGARCRLVAKSPAPQVGDPLHYDAFLKRLCEHYTMRFPV
jgi:hypothetical protein